MKADVSGGSFLRIHRDHGDRVSSVTKVRATIDDLYRARGKAELIAGKIVPLMPMGHKSSRVASQITRSLHDYAEAVQCGATYTGKMAFTVPELSSGRESFSPDASYYDGPLPSNEMDFIDGPPKLAVEVRSKSDYRSAAEQSLGAKRADYFEAGTAVVWDVDPVNEVVRKYQRDLPDQATVFSHGQEADAEPALPGWRMGVEGILGDWRVRMSSRLGAPAMVRYRWCSSAAVNGAAAGQVAERSRGPREMVCGARTTRNEAHCSARSGRMLDSGTLNRLV